MAFSPLKILLPKGKGKAGGRGYVPGYNPSQVDMSAPGYRNHLTDIYNSRRAGDSRTLLNDLVNHDPDVSAAVHSYLTIAGSAEMDIFAYSPDGEIDPEGVKTAIAILDAVTVPYDYTTGYQNKVSLQSLTTSMRYMALLRGTIATELVLDKSFVPFEIRLIDSATVLWRQKKNGVYSPYQKVDDGEIDLNVPTFFTSNFHQNPTDVYTYSPFVSAINAIAARQEVINELYRIMQVVGYPRMDITVLEEVLANNAPTTVRSDPKKLRAHVETEIGRINSSIVNIRSDQAFVHSSAIEAKIINDKNPGAGMQIQQVIDVLDAQNQAALKVMPAVIGKGSNGQTTSTEARLFAMSADALNRVVADSYSQALTLAARLTGYAGRIEARFRPVELRPTLELEPQLVMKSSRLRQELSLGTITDIEYHMQMFGRPPPAGAPQLSGTNFLDKNDEAASVDAEGVSPNGDSLGRGLAPPGGKSQRSNKTKRGEVG